MAGLGHVSRDLLMRWWIEIQVLSGCVSEVLLEKALAY